MTDPKPPQWPVIAGGVLAIIGVMASVQNWGRKDAQIEIAQVEQGRRIEDKMSNMLERVEMVRKEVQQVNQLSIERAQERREEMLQRHTQQQREIDELREEFRQLREKRK